MSRLALIFLLSLIFIVPNSSRAEGEVDILWQGETYTPPFYEGLPLWTNESRITFIAIPNLPNTDPSSLYYRWSKDGVVLGSLSGVNRRSLALSDTVLSLPIEVKVDIRDGEEGEILGTRVVTLSPTTAKVLVVENHPLYGLLFNKTISGTHSLTESEATFSAIPLFGNVTFRNAPALTYTWRTNTGEVSTGSKVTYRAPEDARGSSSVRLKVSSSRVLVQPKEVDFLIQFDNQQGF